MADFGINALHHHPLWLGDQKAAHGAASIWFLQWTVPFGAAILDDSMLSRPLVAMYRFSTLLALMVISSSTIAVEPINFNRDIRPLLSNQCFRCHGPDAEAREAGLRLDQAAAATQELDSGDRAIVPGDVEASQLLARIESEDEDLRMPPADIGPPLNAVEIDVLKRWIRQGANYEKHWSLKPIVRSAIPGQGNDVRVDGSSSIDRFINDALKKQKIHANPMADRRTLVRRITLAVTGLPPTRKQVARFVDDKNPRAYERLVERLLASPRFGERWARVWLDIARYADSAGYAQDPARTIWRYRDWVIRCL